MVALSWIMLLTVYFSVNIEYILTVTQLREKLVIDTDWLAQHDYAHRANKR